MGAAIGLVFGVGAWLLYRSFTVPWTPRRSTPTRSRGVSQLLAAAGVTTVSATALGWLVVLSGVLTGLLVVGVSRTPPIALAFGGMAAYAPIALLRSRARRRRRDLADVWPEAVDNLASAVRAGLSLPEALTQLGERGPVPLRAPFAAFGRDYLSSGRFGAALDLLKERLADPIGDRVVEALRIAREVGGGDLGTMLRTLSRFLRDDARTRAELEARQAWVVNGARLATAAPWAVLLVLSTQPDVIGRYRSAGGVLVLALGGGACLIAYRLMVRLGRLPEDRRVLA